MKPATTVVFDLVERIAPCDDLERQHLARARAWLCGTDDIFRRIKPDVPSPHLVSYVVLVDPAHRAVYLGRHRKAGLNLPMGGHVEPGEHPLDAARREAREELGIDPEFSVVGTDPLMLTVTSTVGADSHVDVSLWFVIRGVRDHAYALDAAEFDGGRWWDIEGDSVPDADPHFPRFLNKLAPALRLAIDGTGTVHIP